MLPLFGLCHVLPQALLVVRVHFVGSALAVVLLVLIELQVREQVVNPRQLSELLECN